MQLNGTPPSSGPAAGHAATHATVHAALAAAAAGLLGLPAAAQAPAAPAPAASAAAAPQAAAQPAAWQLDSAVLVYSESGGRVKAVEPVVALRRADGNDRVATLKLTLDALTGASPNGAIPQPVPQTFTSPSGRSTYDVAAGAAPLDPSFRDTRIALNGGWEQPLGDGLKLNLGANLSGEHDFFSAGLNAAVAADFDRKNTTVSLGLALEADRIQPEGGIPTGLKPMFGAAQASKAGSDTRQVVDLLAGVTQVMSRTWLMQVNLNFGRGSGYHTDPYKLLSVIDEATGRVTGSGYVAESRPDSRTRTSLFWQNKVHLGRDVVDASYRFYRDDWGIRAHTVDLRYRWALQGAWYLEPHLRWYRQGAADFWRAWLAEGRDWSSASGTTSLAHASADPRLGAFSATTLGLKFARPINARSEWSVRAEVYRQTPRAVARPASLQGLDLTPGLTAAAVTVGYSLDF